MSDQANNDNKPNAAFLEALAARINAGPPKKPVGLLKKPTHSAETTKEALPEPAAGRPGGIAALAGAMATAAAAKGLGEADKKDEDTKN